MIVVRVALKGCNFEQDVSVDETEPLVDLCGRICDEQGVSLRTKSGRPVAWLAEGPDIRPGKEDAITDLVRTQDLVGIAAVMRSRVGEQSPLFTVIFDVPGADEAVRIKRDGERLADIQTRLAEREQERVAEEEEAKIQRIAAVTDAEDLTMRPGYTGPHPLPPPRSASPQAVTPPLGVAPLARPEFPPPPPAPTPAPPVEQRIRRAVADGTAAAPQPRTPPQKSPTSSRLKAVARESSAEDVSRKKRGAKAAKAAAPTKGRKKGALPLPWIVGGGVAVLAVGLLIVVAASGDEGPPTPEPTAEPVVATPADLPAAPEPTAAPVAAPEAPKAPEWKVFWSAGSVDNNSYEGQGAQVTSFAETRLRLQGKVRIDQPGASVSASLGGRFKVRFTDTGGTAEGGGVHPLASLPIGEAVSIEVRHDGESLFVRVGGQNHGPWPAPPSGGFPAFRFGVSSGAVLTDARVSRLEEPTESP